jgi:L-lactate dehydrogenase
VVITAGRGGRPGETRLDLLRDNASIMRSIASQLRGAQGSLIVVSNPVDVLTHVALDASGLPAHRVFGTGTMLDTARLRHALGRELDVDPRSIHAQVLGEHGDSEFVGWSSSRVGGVPLRRWAGWSDERERTIAHEVRTAAYEIIARKGATNHAIGLVTAALMHWSTRDTRRVLTVSRLQKGIRGLEGVVLSLPTIVGRQGAMEVLEPELDAAEREALQRSADVLRAAKASVEA